MLYYYYYYYFYTLTMTAAGRFGERIASVAAATAEGDRGSRRRTKSTEFRHGISIVYTACTLCRRFVGQYEIFILEIIFFSVLYRLGGMGNYRPTAVRHCSPVWSVLLFFSRCRRRLLLLGEFFISCRL